MAKKVRKPKPITREEFCSALEGLLEGMSSDELLAIPGVYEAVSEELNNEAIAAVFEARRKAAEEAAREKTNERIRRLLESQPKGES